MAYGRKRKRSSSVRTVKRRRYTTMRRRYKRRNSFRPQSQAAAYRLSRSIVPKKMLKTFNYSEKVTMNAPLGGATASYFYSCNSLYDPNRSAAGHQPLGFDQYLGILYDHYVVIGAKITVTWMAQDATLPGANIICAILTRDTNTSTSDITQAIEQGRTTYGFLGSADGRNSTLSLTQKVNPAKWLGRSNPLSDPQLKGSVAGNPQEECFFELLMASLNGDDPPSTDLLVTIQYKAVLIEPVRLAQS